MAPTKTKKPLPLTARELKVLEYIEQYVHGQGIAPTYSEIKEHFGFASFNSVQRYLKQLQDKNYIHSPGENQKRAIQVLHSSKSISNSLEAQNKSELSTLTPQNPFPTQTKKENSTGSPPHVESLSLPLLGRVAAGTPIEAFTHNEYVEVPSSLIRHPGKTFGLIVQGQSMIEDGILDGDVIFVQKQTYANNGETIVATVENQATVKRFYLHRTSNKDIHSNPQSKPQAQAEAKVELRPANSTMKSMWFTPEDVNIQGIVVGLIRRF